MIAGIIISVIGALLGLLMIGAGAMSDAPAEGDKSAMQGLLVLVASIAILVLSIIWR